MIQPISFDDMLVSTTYGIVKVRRKKRVANIGKEGVSLEKGQHIATVNERS